MQDYKQLFKIGEKLNDDGFCAVIALCTVLDISFKRAKRKLEKLGRKHRKGTPTRYTLKALSKHGFKTVRLEHYLGRKYRDAGITANQAQNRYNKGTYLVTFHGSIDHIACLKDGKYNDWIDKKYQGTAPKFEVCEIYQVTKKEI